MNKLIHYILPALLIVLLSLSVANKSNAQDQAIMVIANDKGAPATMTMKELKSVMLGEKQRWADGTKVSIAFMKANTSVGSSTAKKNHGHDGRPTQQVLARTGVSRQSESACLLW